MAGPGATEEGTEVTPVTGRLVRVRETTEEVTHRVGAARKADEAGLMESPKGRVSLPYWRTTNAREMLAYLLARLPSTVAGHPAA